MTLTEPSLKSWSHPLGAFKDVTGRWRNRSLFIEFKHPDYPAFFTLDDVDKTVDGVTYISAKRKYLEYKDPTEHTFAEAVFGTYACWKFVSASPDISPHVERWRVELELHLRSIGFQALLAKARSGDVAAAKALASGKHPTSVLKKSGSAGRPSKAGAPEFRDEDARSDAFNRLFPQVTGTCSPTLPAPWTTSSTSWEAEAPSETEN